MIVGQYLFTIKFAQQNNYNYFIQVLTLLVKVMAMVYRWDGFVWQLTSHLLHSGYHV